MGSTTTRRHELLFDALLQGGLGLTYTAFTLIMIWLGTWFLCMQWDSHTSLFGRVPLGATLTVAVVSSWSAWREVDPLAHLTRPTAAERTTHDVEGAGLTAGALAGAGGAAPVALLSPSRRAGCALLLLEGPRGVLRGWKTFRRWRAG